jgi:hypothetical protein
LCCLSFDLRILITLWYLQTLLRMLLLQSTWERGFPFRIMVLPLQSTKNRILGRVWTLLSPSDGEIVSGGHGYHLLEIDVVQSIQEVFVDNLEITVRFQGFRWPIFW